MIKDSHGQLKRDEGEILVAYQDHLGFWTIGVGILIDKRKNGGLRPEESEFIFNNRLKIITEELKSRLPWFTKLDEARRGALVNMAFQLGVNGLINFKNTMALVAAGKYEAAGVEMLKSEWAKQTPARAYRISNQMRWGEWQ